ncbi:MAG: RDD family protein [Burkholderiales bacterium]
MTAQTGLPFAPLLRRTLSLIYEALLVAAVLWCAGFLYAIVESRVSSVHLRAVYQLYLLLIAGIYFVWQWQRGQTLPMRTWRVRLVTRSGAAVSFGQAVARFVFATVGLLLLGLGFFWALVDPERQFLHDRLAGTRLVST